MTAVLAGNIELGSPEYTDDVFDLDVQVTTEIVTAQGNCNTDDGCGHTCEISACVSQL